MPIFFFIILGLIQGLTEFLPVSSSGHLALAQHFFDFGAKHDLVVEIVAHFGSLASIVFFYRKSFLSLRPDQLSLKKQKEMVLPLVVSVLPAGFLGFFFQEHFVVFFSDMRVVACGFLITSGLLLSLKYLETRKIERLKLDWPNPTKAFLIGLSQAFALFPGVSRSGSTIVTGMWLGLKPKQAAFFSFCSVIPLIGGASLNLLIKMFANSSKLSVSLPSMAILLFSSFFFGWIGLIIVDRFLEKDRFFYFSFYLMPLSVFLFLV